MKVIITKKGSFYRIYLQNGLFSRLLIDDIAHSKITQRTEADSRADVLRVALALPKSAVLDETGESATAECQP